MLPFVSWGLFMRNVAIVGVGTSRFGVRNDVRIDELAWESVKDALNDAGIEQRDVEFCSVGTFGSFNAEILPAVLCCDYCNLRFKGTLRTEAACATGSAAFFTGFNAVASGFADIVLVLGVEKMCESPTPVAVEFIGRSANYFWEFENFGVTFPGYYALHATAYMNKYGAGEEDLARVAVKNHYYGSLNPKAHFRNRISIEEAVKSRYVAWPLKLYDCCPISDGSAAVILASEEAARKLTDTPIWVRGIGVSNDSANMSRRSGFTSLAAAVDAARKAYRMAGIDYDDPLRYVDVANVHDCFTIAEIMAYEDLNFAKRGEGYLLLREEQTYIGGKIPVNVDGGLKAKGHPLGATGVGMIAELTKQLRKQVENGRQASIAKGNALAHNVGGTGHYCYITILSLEKPKWGG
jgi:acetyl-CoA C-acetyltransferase